MYITNSLLVWSKVSIFLKLQLLFNSKIDRKKRFYFAWSVSSRLYPDYLTAKLNKLFETLFAKKAHLLSGWVQLNISCCLQI